MPELKPCPECGDGDFLLVVKNLPSEEWSVYCGCGHNGMLYKTRAEAIEAHNSLPRALRFTSDPPKVAGWYWLRDLNFPEESCIVCISNQQSERLCEKGAIPFTEYAGPIPTPLD